MDKFALFLKTTLLDPFIRSFKRFTDSIVLSVLLVILAIVSQELKGSIVFLSEILPFLWLTLPLLIFKTLLVERLKVQTYWQYVFSAVSLVVTASIYLLMKYAFPATNIIFSLRMAALWIIFIILALIVNYFPKKDNFAHYLVFLLTKLFLTIFYAAVLYGGLFAIIASIEALFAINFSTYIYIDLYIAVAGLVAVPVFVGFIPRIDEVLNDNDYHKIWRTVFAFIVVPLIMLFSAILIVYILTSFANVNYYGTIYLVSALVTVFLSLAMIFLLEKFEVDYPHVRFFNKYWPFVMVAILIGFFYELILALVNQGFTLATSIYFYLGLALIALLIVRLLKFSYKLGHGQIIGATSFVTAITIAFVPFINILNLATYSANIRFETLLTQAGMLVNGEIIPANNDVTDEQKNDITNYVISFQDIGFERIRCLPQDFKLEDFESVFGFPQSFTVNPNHAYLAYSTNVEVIDFSNMNSAAYQDFLYIPSLNLYQDIVSEYSSTYDDEASVWTLLKDDLEIIEIDMAAVLENFHELFETMVDYELDLYTQLKYTPSSEEFDVYFVGLFGLFSLTEETYSVSEANFYLGIK
ncbi:MAG: DUF4153 domain-containing protein [Bacilli bacterium]|nr:DUF4153 domain-containing protein [Bacilli bacterium]